MREKSTGQGFIQPSLEVIPELPTTIVMSDGREYDVTGDVWIFPEDPDSDATVRINWKLLTDVVVPETRTPVMSVRAMSLAKLYVLERLGAVGSTFKPASGRCIYQAMLRLARFLALHPICLPRGRGFCWNDLTGDIFNLWLAEEYQTKIKGDNVNLVRRFYLWGADPDVNLPDFSLDLASELCTWRLKNHATGELVESRDARRGPFTREESENISRACVSGAGKDQDRALAWTLLLTGMRPKQIHLLKHYDLEVINTSVRGEDSDDLSSQANYRLRVRKIKRPGKAIEYHYLPISVGCAQLLLNLRKPGSGPNDRLFWWVTSWYHKYIDNRLMAFSRDANLRSRRLPLKEAKSEDSLGEFLHITARRFRYAMATHRIAGGDSPENVADSLGHKGIEYVRTYTETSPRIADDFQHATDYVIRPLIDLMEGHCHLSECKLLTNVTSNKSSKQRTNGNANVFWSDRAGSHYSPAHKGKRHKGRVVRLAAGLEKPETRINDLIARARNKFPLIYPKQDFDDELWDASHLRERPHVGRGRYLHFAPHPSLNVKQNRLATNSEDFGSSYFWDLIKSLIVIFDNFSLGFIYARLEAARYFWDFLLTYQEGKAGSFVWCELSEDDFIAFEQFLGKYKTHRGGLFEPGTICLIIYHMQRLVDTLTSLGICRHIEYIPQTSSKTAQNIASLDEKELIDELKLPAPGIPESLASIYHRLTAAPGDDVDDWMLIIISAIALLMLTGLRIGELVTLPYDCEVEDKYSNGLSGELISYRYGLRYWVEKARKKTMRVKWISPTAESVVRASVARIKKLTAAARERAMILEADTSRVTLPIEIASRTTLSRQEVRALLGRTCNSKRRIERDLGLLPEYGKRNNRYYNVKDLEAYLLARRVQQLYTIRHDDGTFQMLSESLFIIFNNQQWYKQTSPCLLLVEPVRADTIAYYLSGPNNIFKMYGNTQWERELSTNPHALRHWLIHTAYEGGMETEMLLRYFAKKYASGIVDYLHFKTEESEAYAPEELSADRFYVPAGILNDESRGL